MSAVKTGIVVLACGAREWTAYGAIESTVAAIHFQQRIIRLIHGACRGADTMAGEAAARLAIPIVRYPARWQEHGRAAGPRRNRQMLAHGKPDLVVAFHDHLIDSRGTRDMVEQAIAGNVPVWIVQSTGAKMELPAGSRRLFS